MIACTPKLQPASTSISRVWNALDHSKGWITRVPLPTEICDAESQQTCTQLLDNLEMGYKHTCSDYRPDRTGSIEEGPSLLKFKSTPNGFFCVCALLTVRKKSPTPKKPNPNGAWHKSSRAKGNLSSGTITSDFSQCVFRSFILAVCRKYLEDVTWNLKELRSS